MGEHRDFGLNLFIVSLAFGIFVRTVCSRRIKYGYLRKLLKLFQEIPYTVWILLFGVMIGLIDLSRPSQDMASSVFIWQNIDVHVLLYVFLPALLFQSSFSIDPHIIRHEALQIFCLAGPGVLTSTILTACFVRLFYSTFSWNLAFLFGAMLSATDPVAVVALLKELGVDERLGTLIEGESLMNDGTAIVIFTVALKALTEEHCCDGVDIFAWACRLALGGPFLGILVGEITVWLLSYIENDIESEVVLTIVSAYSAYIIAESTPLKFSGVLSVVFCAHHIKVWTVFNEKSEEYIRNFWEVVEFIADTLVFVVSGLIVAQKVWEGHIKNKDWASLFLLYVIIHVIRLIIMMFSWPILKSKNSYGKKWDHKQLFVLVFCGLRGTVGLALALIADLVLDQRKKKYDERNSSIILFTMSGIVFLTLVINGSLTQPLIKKLKLNRISSAEEELFHHSCSLVETKLQEHVDDCLKTDVFLGDAQYHLVWRYIPIYCPIQYWHRIEQRKIILSPNEQVNACNHHHHQNRTSTQKNNPCQKLNIFQTIFQKCYCFFSNSTKKGKRKKNGAIEMIGNDRDIENAEEEDDDDDDDDDGDDDDDDVNVDGRYCPPALQLTWNRYHRKYFERPCRCSDNHFPMNEKAFRRSVSGVSSTNATWTSQKSGRDTILSGRSGIASSSIKGRTRRGYDSSVQSEFGSVGSNDQNTLENKARRYRYLLTQINLKLKRKLTRDKHHFYWNNIHHHHQHQLEPSCSFDETRTDDFKEDLDITQPISDDVFGVTALEEERFKDAISKGRDRFITAVRASYVANQHRGRMQASTLRYLRESADHCLDDTERPLEDWSYLESRLRAMSQMWYLNFLQRSRAYVPECLAWFITELCRRIVFSEVAMIQEVASAFMFTRAEIDLDELVDDDIVKAKVWKESDDQIQQVIHFLHDNLEWTEISNAIKTRTASKLLLIFHIKVVNDLLSNGTITENDQKTFSFLTIEMIRKVNSHPIIENFQSIESILYEGIMGPLKHRHLAIMDHVPRKVIHQLLHLEEGSISKRRIYDHQDDEEDEEDDESYVEEISGQVVFKEVFVKPHVKLFLKGSDVVHEANDDSMTGKHYWFILVRGMIHAHGVENTYYDGEVSEEEIIHDISETQVELDLKQQNKINHENVDDVDDDGESVSSEEFVQSTSFDVYAEEKHDILEPGAMIGWTNQLLGKPMNATFTTTSFCHLIAVDTQLYLKVVCSNHHLFHALFKTLALDLIHELLGIKLNKEVLSTAKFMTVHAVCQGYSQRNDFDVIDVDVDEFGGGGDSGGGEDEEGGLRKWSHHDHPIRLRRRRSGEKKFLHGYFHGNKYPQPHTRSQYFSDFSEFQSSSPPSSSLTSSVETTQSIRQLNKKVSFSSSSNMKMFYVELDGSKWYLLLRGSILGRWYSWDIMKIQNELLNEIKQKQLNHIKLKKNETMNEDMNNQFEELISQLYKIKLHTSYIPTQEAPYILKQKHGKIRVSARSVVLELPQIMKIGPVLFQLYHQAQENIFKRKHISKSTIPSTSTTVSSLFDDSHSHHFENETK